MTASYVNTDEEDLSPVLEAPSLRLLLPFGNGPTHSGRDRLPQPSRKKDFANEHPSLPPSGLLWYLTGMQGEVLTVEEVAKLLRVSRKTVEKLIYAKKLHAVKVGRVWRIPRAAVEAFLGGKEYREP